MKKNSIGNSQIIVLGICIAAATIIASIILSQGFMKVMKITHEQITVTGSAQKSIKSDYIAWTGTFSRRSDDLSAAYKELKNDAVKVKAYLISKGINEKEIITSQVYTTVLYKKNEKGNDTNDIQGYLLSQNFDIKSSNVEKITMISRESTDLINQGVGFVSCAPSYTYTKLDELKVEMLASASENAKQRAEKMLAATGSKIGVMRSAKMGVFQITPDNSTEISDYGINDTSSLNKKVVAVVSASFAIE